MDCLNAMLAPGPTSPRFADAGRRSRGSLTRLLTASLLLVAFSSTRAGADPVVEAQVKLCWSTASSDPGSAIGVAEAAIPRARQAGDAAAAVELRLCRGYANEAAGRLDLAEAAYELGVAEGERIHDDRLVASALLLRGEIRHARGRFDDALNDLQRAYRLNRDGGRDRQVRYALNAIANVYADANVGDYDKALEYYRLLLAANEKAGDPEDVATAHFNIGSTLDNKGDPQAALPELQKALDLERARGDPEQIAYCERSLAIVLTKLGRAREALVHLDAALATFARLKDTAMVAATRLSRGGALRQLERSREALADLEAARAHYEPANNDRFLVKIQSERAEAAAALLDWHVAFEARSAQLGIERRLTEQRKQETASRLRVQFDTERKEQENRALQRENTLQARILALSVGLLALAGYAAARKLGDARRLRGANEQLARQNAVLAENVRLQEEVERVSRHDLRTPLAGAIALMKRLRRTPGLDGRQLELMRLVEQSSYRVMDLVNLSVGMLKMERGTYHLNARPVDLVDLLRHVASDLEGHAGSKGVRIEIRNGQGGLPGPCWALGEELLCYSMFANTLKNAVEASPDGARVIVEADVEGEAGGTAALARVRVSNRGAVPVPLRATFFDKFATGGKPGGTGLGTYSARLMAATQRGRIAMTTSEEQGTTIEIVLPAAAPDGPRPSADHLSEVDPVPRPGVQVAGAALHTLDALIADDEAISALILEGNLAACGLRVTLAVNGRAGLDAFERQRPDLVLVDMEMPVMNGPEMVRRLREHEKSGERRAFVVGLTAHEDPAQLARFHEAGCDRCLAKPVEPEDVDRIVAEVRAMRLW